MHFVTNDFLSNYDSLHYAFIFFHIPLLPIALFTSTGMDTQEVGTPKIFTQTITYLISRVAQPSELGARGQLAANNHI